LQQFTPISIILFFFIASSSFCVCTQHQLRGRIFWGWWDFKKEKHIGKEQKIYNLTLLILIKFLGQFWKINTEISYEKKRLICWFFFI
jgi:hypothetical protein